LLAEYFCEFLSSIPVRAGCGKNVAQRRLLFAKFPWLITLVMGSFALCGTTIVWANDPLPGRNYATISASPNPVLIGEITQGTTTIKWNTGDNLPGQVYVSHQGEPDRLFAEAAGGSSEASWIAAGEYEFRLYAGIEHRRQLASVVVTGSHARNASSSLVLLLSCLILGVALSLFGRAKSSQPLWSRLGAASMFNLGLIGELCAGYIVITYLAILLLVSGGFLLHIPISPYHFPLGMITGVVFWSWFAGEQRRVVVASIGMFFLLGIGGLCLAVAIPDLSYDGQAYHAEAIMQLSRGWIPLYDSGASDHFRWPNGFWVVNYPKASWMLGAAIYKTTGRIEATKVANVLVLIASFFFSYRATRLLIPVGRLLATTSAILFCFNPVSTCQLFSNYVDGQITSLTVIIMSAAALWMVSRRRRYLLVIGAAFVIITNLKFTGLILAAYSCGAILFMCFVFFRNKQQCLEGVAWLGASLLIGAVFVGASPYMQHLASKKHIFFPLVGKNRMNPLRHIRPPDLEGANPFARFSTGIFSRSVQTRWPNECKPKKPWQLFPDELSEFAAPDAEPGGFGPVFGLAICATAIAIGICLAACRHFVIPLTVMGFLLLSVFANPESWWARYVPQLGLVPALGFISILSSPHMRHRISMALVLSLPAFVNMWLVCAVNWSYCIHEGLRLQEALHQLANRKAPVAVCFGPFVINEARFREKNISFFEVSAREVSERTAAGEVWENLYNIQIRRENSSKIP
jgi:hypothetical protein